MNIGFIIPSFYPATAYGGPAFASWDLAKELGAVGHRVRVSTTNANLREYLPLRANEETEVAENLFVTYYHDTILNRLSVPQIRALTDDIMRADVVHVHSVFNILAPVAVRVALALEKPVLLTPHGSLSPDALLVKKNHKKLWLWSLIRPVAKRIAWHATSNQEAGDIKAATGSSDIYTIRHGLSGNMPAPVIMNRADYFAKFAPGCAPGPAIVSMGRLEKTKGFDILIRAFHQVHEKIPNAVLIIAGPDQGERGRLVSLAQSLGIAKSVVFHNFLEAQNRSDFLANADLFALASHHENFGLVYAEALSFGTPIVATTGTPWEGVEKAECGRWVACEPPAIADALSTLLDRNGPELRAAAAAYARQFSIRDVANTFTATYEKIAGWR